LEKIVSLKSTAISKHQVGTVEEILELLKDGIWHDWYQFPSEDTDATEVIYPSNKYLWYLVVEGWRTGNAEAELYKYDLPYTSLAVQGGTGKLLGSWILEGEALKRAVEVVQNMVSHGA